MDVILLSGPMGYCSRELNDGTHGSEYNNRNLKQAPLEMAMGAHPLGIA